MKTSTLIAEQYIFEHDTYEKAVIVKVPYKDAFGQRRTKSRTFHRCDFNSNKEWAEAALEARNELCKEYAGFSYDEIAPRGTRIGRTVIPRDAEKSILLDEALNVRALTFKPAAVDGHVVCFEYVAVGDPTYYCRRTVRASNARSALEATLMAAMVHEGVASRFSRRRVDYLLKKFEKWVDSNGYAVRMEDSGNSKLGRALHGYSGVQLMKTYKRRSLKRFGFSEEAWMGFNEECVKFFMRRPIPAE